MLLFSGSFLPKRQQQQQQQQLLEAHLAQAGSSDFIWETGASEADYSCALSSLRRTCEAHRSATAHLELGGCRQARRRATSVAVALCALISERPRKSRPAQEARRGLARSLARAELLARRQWKSRQLDTSERSKVRVGADVALNAFALASKKFNCVASNALRARARCVSSASAAVSPATSVPAL